MKCPECVKQGERSRVEIGMTTRTLMATHAWYDEDGQYHYDDPNKSTTQYSCSNGHRWTEVEP